MVLIIRFVNGAVEQLRELTRRQGKKSCGETVRDALRIYGVIQDFRQPDGSIIIHKKRFLGLVTNRYKLFIP